MPLASGTRLGPFEIVAPLGAGGMGEVYRARDDRLGREVAVKVLPAGVVDHADAEARFAREARAASALNHPNIVVVHDVGRSGDVSWVAMELVEGTSLRQVLTEGRPPLRRALQIGAQIADGLAAAHEKGITHRDLKPENVVVRPDGRAKILDFGLAKAAPKEAGSEDETIRAAEGATAPGIVLGTPSYMSPEQASGRPVDFHSDQFSFGSVFYEMVTGRRAFRRDTLPETLASILREEPEPAGEIDPALPLPVLWVLERCLAKEPSERYASTRDLARDLAALAEHLPSISGKGAPAAEAPAPPPAKGRIARPAALALAALLLVAFGIVAGWRLAPGPGEPPSIRSLTFSGRDREPAIAPDGKSMVFTSERDGTPRIWIKQFASGSETALTIGPDVAPRFMPDGAAVLFTRVAGGRPSLLRVPAVGGETRHLLDDAGLADPSPDGSRIAFLRAVPERGRTVTVLSVSAADGSGPKDLWRTEGTKTLAPRWSPDGRTIAVAAGPRDFGSDLPWRIAIVPAAGGDARTLSPAAGGGRLSTPAWISPGEILYAWSGEATGDFGGRLVAQRLSGGSPRTLLSAGSFGWVLDVSRPGRVVAEVPVARENLQLQPTTSPAAPHRWLTRGSARDRQPVFSADGASLVFSSNRNGTLDLWRLDLSTGGLFRLTDEKPDDRDPFLTRDGRHLLWSSTRSGHHEIWIAGPDGSNARQVSNDGTDAGNPTSPADGSFIVYASFQPEKSGIWRVRPDGTDSRLLVSGFVAAPQVSPDGRWVLATVPASATRAVVRVVGAEGGAPAPFEIEVPVAVPAAHYLAGRAAWMPDGRAIAFVGQDGSGRSGIFVQDFLPGRDTSASRRPLAGFDGNTDVESFGVSPDGRTLALAVSENLSSLVLVEGLAGVDGKGGPR